MEAIKHIVSAALLEKLGKLISRNWTFILLKTRQNYTHISFIETDKGTKALKVFNQIGKLFFSFFFHKIFYNPFVNQTIFIYIDIKVWTIKSYHRRRYGYWVNGY